MNCNYNFFSSVIFRIRPHIIHIFFFVSSETAIKIKRDESKRASDLETKIIHKHIYRSRDEQIGGNLLALAMMYTSENNHSANFKMDVSPVSPSPSDQQYALKWNDFQSSILSSFRHLRDEEDFVDVTLACDQRSFTAHKVRVKIKCLIM